MNYRINENAAIKGYITNLGKYNEGYLIGKWISFPVNDDELETIFKEIGISSEPDLNGNVYEEYFMTDYEIDIPGLEFGEYTSIETLNSSAETWESLTEYEKEIAAAIVEAGYENSIEDAAETVNDYTLMTDVKSDYDLGYYWVEESGAYDLRNLGNLAYYIDYERFGRDIHIETDGCFTSYGWLERC